LAQIVFKAESAFELQEAITWFEQLVVHQFQQEPPAEI